MGRFRIKFEYSGYRYYYGLLNSLNEYKLSDERIICLHEKLEAMGTNKCRKSEWWTFYSYFPDLTIDDWINDIIGSDRFIEDCRDKIEMILKALEHIDL